MSTDTQRRGFQTFSSVIGGHSDEGTEHPIVGGDEGDLIHVFIQEGGYCGPATDRVTRAARWRNQHAWLTRHHELISNLSGSIPYLAIGVTWQVFFFSSPL